MSSFIDNPSQLIKCVPYLPKVKFPVYKFNVSNTDWPVRNQASHFRDLDILRPPENATDKDYENEYIFRGIPDSYPSDSKCCYILNPDKYPPTTDGYQVFLQDLHSAHPERYTNNTTRKYDRKKGSDPSEPLRVKSHVIQCSFRANHSKKSSKTKKVVSTSTLVNIVFFWFQQNMKVASTPTTQILKRCL